VNGHHTTCLSQHTSVAVAARKDGTFVAQISEMQNEHANIPHSFSWVRCSGLSPG